MLSTLICTFPTLVYFFIPTLALSKTPFSFACSFVDGVQREIHNSLVPFFQIYTIILIFLLLAVGTVATFSMMMFSNAIGSSLYDIVVRRNLKFDKLSSISLLTASIFCSSVTTPNLLSNLFVSLMNVLRMWSICSRLSLCLFQRCC